MYKLTRFDMANQLRWHGDEARRKIRREMERRIHAATVVVLNHAKGLISVDGTGGAGGGKRAYGSNPSAPGEPPHKQYGHLRRNVAREVVGLRGRVGTNVLYGRWLELGTKKMAPRPWLQRSLDECRVKIRTILSREIK